MANQTATAKIDYPTHPINMIVPFSAGGGLDLQARSLEKVALTYLHQPLIVLNKPGGGGVFGWNELAGANPDGYTVGLTSTEVLLQPLFGSTRYHYITALEPLAQISTTPLVMMVNAEQPWKSVDDVVQYGKRHPGVLKVGNAGIGSIGHIAGEVFAKLEGLRLEQVPFRGGGESVGALLGKHVQIVFASPSVVKDQIKAGRLKPLAITGERRLTNPDLANIPTFKEQGVDLVLMNWTVVAVPKALPPEVKATLTAALKKMILDPEFKANLENLGVHVEYLDAETSLDHWIEQYRTLRKMVTETGVLEQVKQQKGD